MRPELQLSQRSPRDRFITIYGRVPVLEVLRDESLDVDKVVLENSARGAHADEIVGIAGRRGIRLIRATSREVTRLSRNGRHDQGVVADVVAPRMQRLEEASLEGHLLLLDGVTNPSNVGLILRSATAAGAGGVILPRRGVPEIGPLVVKASAGVAFRAPVLIADDALGAAEFLGLSGYRVYGLAADGPRSLFDPRGLAAKAAFVVGNETDGVSTEVGKHVHEWVSIPLANDVESLNVSVAASVVVFELLRRRLG